MPRSVGIKHILSKVKLDIKQILGKVKLDITIFSARQLISRRGRRPSRDIIWRDEKIVMIQLYRT